MNRGALIRSYTALHEGLLPTSIRSVRLPRPTATRVDIGRATAIEYDKSTPRGLEGFRHDFGPGAGPVLQHDERGKLQTAGGRYRVTTKGIVDMAASNTRYSRGYPMAQRVNPSEMQRRSKEMNYTQFAVEGAKIGGTAIVMTLASDMVFRRTDFSYAMRGGIGGAFGIITGLLVARWMPALGIGLFTYGLTYFGRYTAASINMQRFLTNVTSGTRAQLPAPGQAPTSNAITNAATWDAATPAQRAAFGARPAAGLPFGPHGASAIRAVRLAQPLAA